MCALRMEQKHPQHALRTAAAFSVLQRERALGGAIASSVASVDPSASEAACSRVATIFAEFAGVAVSALVLCWAVGAARARFSSTLRA